MATSRFASLNTDEFEKILKEKDALNTRKATKAAVDVLQAYLVAKKLSTNVEKTWQDSNLGNTGKILLGGEEGWRGFFTREGHLWVFVAALIVTWRIHTMVK